VEFAYWIIEINQPRRNYDRRHNWQIVCVTGATDQVDLALRDCHGFCENVDTIKANAGNVLEASLRVDASLLKCAVDDS